MEKLRLDKFLSSQLNISRSDAKALVRKGQITVNNKQCKASDLQLMPQTDIVCCAGKPLSYKQHIYIMMNKPSGVVSASNGDAQVNVIDILPNEYKRAGLFPAGRLDKDTTGFMLITDDGEFAHSILSPSKHISKTYELTAKREVTDDELLQFMQGIDLGDIVLKPASLKLIGADDELDGCPVYSITITEGRYHQIKRMFAKFGNRVLKLKRTHMGSLCLDVSLLPGECREITDSELELIKTK